MLQTRLESLLLLKLLKIDSAEKKYAWKVTRFGALSLKKILNTPLTWNIFKGLTYVRFRV